MKIINLFGAPGHGKSTLALGLVNHMKKCGDSVELVDEFAKIMVYENNLAALKCQPYLFARQLYRIELLRGQVDYVVTDSPLLLNIIYNKYYPESFHQCILDIHNTLDNINFLLERPTDIKFKDYGRIHNPKQSVLIQNQIKDLFETHKISNYVINPYNIQFDNLVSMIKGN